MSLMMRTISLMRQDAMGSLRLWWRWMEESGGERRVEEGSQIRVIKISQFKGIQLQR